VRNGATNPGSNAEKWSIIMQFAVYMAQNEAFSAPDASAHERFVCIARLVGQADGAGAKCCNNRVELAVLSDNKVSFFELSLCLSGAWLGKTIILSIQSGQCARVLTEPGLVWPPQRPQV
jgi:hypothetical protein